MFSPRYTITDKLLSNVKQINSLVLELNSQKFPRPVLAKLKKAARAISAYASTSIEGNPLSLTDVKRILKSRPGNIRNSEQEVLNYNQALEKLDQRLKNKNISLSTDLILFIHQQVTRKLIPDFRSGKFRQEPVFVNNPKTGETIYLPPDAKDVPWLMNELIELINSQKGIVDPLILAGIFHKQFMIIHPFMDGNGRTGRLIAKTLLAQMGLNTFNLFSFENYYNQNVTAYFNHVGVFGNYYELVSAIEFTGWLEYFTDGIINELYRVRKELSAVFPTPATELETHHQKILKIIKVKGYITDREYVKYTNRAKSTRILDFKKLVGLGLIKRKGKGRATYYVSL